MADDKLNINPSAPRDGDDTVTRKTIRLRSIPQTSPVSPAQPRSGVSTDTGNIELADDTRTRKTIKLKPISPLKTAAAPTPAPTAAPAAAPAPAAVAPVSDGEDTVTRKTLVLKPLAPTAAPAAPAPAPSAPAAPAPAAAPEADGDDTVTRKTIKLKPATPAASAQSAPAAPAPAAAAPAAEDSGEKTIRIQRPVKPLTTGPAVTPKPVSAAPAAAPKVAVPPQAVKVPPVQKPQLPPTPSPTFPTAPANVDIAMPEASAGAKAPSMLYLILAVISLICLIYSTMLITVQFLDLTQGQKVADEFPSGLLPRAK